MRDSLCLRAFWNACLLAAITISVLPTGVRAEARPSAPPPAGKEKATVPEGLATIEQAFKLLYSSDAWAKTQTQPVTSAAMRAAIADPPVQQALRQFHTALDQPFHFPAGLPEVVFPTYVRVREAARLMGMAETIALEDGKPQEAIGYVNNGLRLGALLKTVGVMPMLIGDAIDAIVLTPAAEGLDKFSAEDCAALLRTLDPWLAKPDSFPTTLDNDRRNTIAFLLQTIDGGRNKEGLKQIEADPNLSASDKAAWRAVITDSKAYAAFRSLLESRINTLYSLAGAHYKTGPNAPVPSSPPASGKQSPLFTAYVAPVTGNMLPTLVSAGNKARENRTLPRLLAVQAHLRRYHLEHGQYPERLEDLNAGSLIADPFLPSGAPLTYTRNSEGGFTLESIGYTTLDSNGNARSGHQKVTLPWKAANVTKPKAP